MKKYFLITSVLVATIFNPPAKVLGQTSSPFTCQQIAIDYAQRESLRGQLFVGGLIGTAAGVGIGSAFAASGVGAAIGATVGVLGGIILREHLYKEIYVVAFNDCMSNRSPRRWG
jgi:hypothetical protein